MGKIVSGENEFTIGSSWADGQYLKLDTGAIVSAAVSSSGGGGIVYDTQANRPAASTEGLEFVSTDGLLPVRQVDSGAAWLSFYNGYQCSVPPSYSTFTAVNSDASNTFSDINGGLYLKQMGRASSEFMTAYVKELPAAPYTLTVGIKYLTLNQAAYSYAGICLTDGTSNPKFANFNAIFRGSGVTDMKLQNGYYNNPTAWSADNTVTTLHETNLSWPAFFLRIIDDSTNRIYRHSSDGVNWVQHDSKSRTDHLTPTHGGLVIGQNGAGISGTTVSAEFTVFHWSLG